MAKPRKHAPISQEQLQAINEEIAHEDRIVPALTEDEIKDALAEYIEMGVKVVVTPNRWELSYGAFPRNVRQPNGQIVRKNLPLTVGGNTQVPIEAVIYGANMLLGNVNYVRAANRKDAQGNRAIGNVLDKDGQDITNAA